jgi:hypothetical protein
LTVVWVEVGEGIAVAVGGRGVGLAVGGMGVGLAVPVDRTGFVAMGTGGVALLLTNEQAAMVKMNSTASIFFIYLLFLGNSPYNSTKELKGNRGNVDEKRECPNDYNATYQTRKGAWFPGGKRRHASPGWYAPAYVNYA